MQWTPKTQLSRSAQYYSGRFGMFRATQGITDSSETSDGVYKTQTHAPIRKDALDTQDGFYGTRTHASIELPQPVAQPQPVKTVTESSVLIDTSISKTEFITEALQKLEDTNPLINIKSLQRKINIQTILDFTLRSGAQLIALVGTKGWGTPLIPFINMVCSKVADWGAGHISDTSLGKGLNTLYTFGKARFEKFLGWIDSKKKSSVKFTGKETQAVSSTSQQAERKLVSSILETVQQFQEQIETPIQPERKPEMASHLFSELLIPMQEYIATQGTTSDQEKMALLERISTDAQSVAKELPQETKVFTDIPTETRRKLLSVVYDALTSALPVVTEWGETVAQEIGMPQERINQVKRLH
jgi:hypothetical protein